MFKLKVAVVITLVMVFSVIQLSFAQSDATCEGLISEILETARAACSEVAAGQACYGAGSASAGDNANFANSGDTAALEIVNTLQTQADEWGIILLNIPQGEESVKMALFGGAQINNAVDAVAENVVTFEVKNGVGYNINMRERPSTGFRIVGNFLWNASGIADGRNMDGSWVHVVVDGTAAWVSAPLVDVDGDINALPLMDSPYIQPMQAFTLTTAPNTENCGAGSSGLLIQYDGDSTAQLQVNGVDLTFGKATLLLQSDSELQVLVMNGSVDLQTSGESVTANTGEAVQIALNSDLTPTAAPVLNPSYSFAAVEGAPISLVSSAENAVCIAGIKQGEAAAYSLPDSDAHVLVSLHPEAHFQVTGWTNSEDGQRWWRVNDGQQVSWIPQDNVQTAGLCSSILEVDPNAPVVQTTTDNSSTASDNSAAPVTDAFSPVPQGRSIWSANSGEEHSTGTCTFPPVAMCQHLVAIIPNEDGSITWRGQEPQPYMLFSSGENFFSYSGRNKLNNANITMGLSFNGESSWTMTMTQVFDNDPQCIRTFYYSATRQW